jgi:hypothetical protein
MISSSKKYLINKNKHKKTMDNNTTFANRVSLGQRITLTDTTTFSNKIVLDQVLVGSTASGTTPLGANNTFSNDSAMESAI